jgi:peptidyl-prolyl cis-trans isomerase B (cyclophilin B)
MKKSPINPLTRLILITCIFLILVALALFGAIYAQFYLTPRQSVSTDDPDLILGSKLEILSQGQMSAPSTNFQTDLASPNALLLPLKTLADFTQIPSASQAALITSKGTLELELYPEQAPLTVKNFLSLAGAGFYDGHKIHRVEPNFVIQVGDPASREATSTAELSLLGAGYPGYRLQDEISSQLSLDAVGILAMANINYDGQYPNTGGSQFFITLAPAPQLNGKYAIFGRVREGLDVLQKLEVGDEILSFEALVSN